MNTSATQARSQFYCVCKQPDHILNVDCFGNHFDKLCLPFIRKKGVYAVAIMSASQESGCFPCL